jgi:hypothetical protein
LGPAHGAKLVLCVCGRVEGVEDALVAKLVA